MAEETWPVDWSRGFLGPAVLAIVADGDTYGYAIARRLDAAGFGMVKGSTLYPLLSRYEATGLLRSSWRDGDGGPGRKFFALTDLGLSTLTTLRSDWVRFARITDALLDGRSPDGPAVTRGIPG